MSRFVGVYNSRMGERYLDLSEVIHWNYNDSKGRLEVILKGGYSQSEDNAGNCELWFRRNEDMGFDALLDEFRKISVKLWEE